jgi:hypothetical protein
MVGQDNFNLNTSKSQEMAGRYFNVTEKSSYNNVINFNIWRNVIISLFLSLFEKAIKFL